MASEPCNFQQRSAERKTVLAGLAWPELLTLGLFVAMVLFEVAFYQQSEDEGRAWMLARSFGLFRLVFHVLRFEGHPAAYYLLLWLPAHLGMPFVWINWISIAIATAGIYLLLRFAPFPLFVRMLLPFGFALGYQYAVDFRSYAFFPTLGFLIAHLYRQRKARPVAMAVALGLLANLSIHGTMIASGFALAYGCKLGRMHRLVTPAKQTTRAAVMGGAIFAASVVFVAICVWPAKYLQMPLGDMIPKVLHRMRGPEVSRLQEPAAATAMRNGATRLAWSEAAFTLPELRRTADQTSMVPADHLADVRHLTFVYPIASWPLLALSFELLLLFYLLRRRELWLVVPFALLTYFLVAVYVQPWHTGLVWLTVVLILWAAWDTSRPTTWRSLQGLVMGLFALIAALQIAWTVGALHYVARHATYPARATAAYLKSLPSTAQIDGNEVAFTVMPYFSRYLFVDHGSQRFEQHGTSPTSLSISDFIAEHADVVLLRENDVSEEGAAELQAAGYKERRRFCGAPYFPHLPRVPVCMVVFQKTDTAQLALHRALPDGLLGRREE